MASLDQVSIAILLGAVLVMAGILSSLLALRFGAPLLLVFLVIGMLAGDSGPGQLQFNDVRTTYLVGSIALALILFDGGLRTRLQHIRTRPAASRPPSSPRRWPATRSTSTGPSPFWSAPSSPRPTRPRCSCWCMRRAC